MLNLPELTSINIFLIWLSVFSVSLLLVFFIALKRQTNKLKDVKRLEKDRWSDLEYQAQKDYQEIIDAANDRAKAIISEATHINEDSQNKLQNLYDKLIEDQKQVLEEATNSASVQYKDQVDLVNKKNIELLSNMYKGIEDYANSSFEEYKKVVERQTFESEKIAQEKIKAKYDELDRELQIEKDEMLKKLNDDIYKIPFNISKMVIGKSLDFSDHEELIIKALNEAKKEGVE